MPLLRVNLAGWRWFFRVVSMLPSQAEFRFSLRAESIGELTTRTSMGIADNLIALPAIFLLIRVIGQYSRIEPGGFMTTGSWGPCRSSPADAFGNLTGRNPFFTDFHWPSCGDLQYFCFMIRWQSIRKKTEPLIWGTALVLLFFMDASGSRPSLCILHALGCSWCPGCGIGHAIHHAMHLHFGASFDAHPLGIPATMVIIYQFFKSIFTTTIKPVLWTNNNY